MYSRNSWNNTTLIWQLHRVQKTPETRGTPTPDRLTHCILGTNTHQLQRQWLQLNQSKTQMFTDGLQTFDTHTHTHTDCTDETSVSEILSISFSRKCQWKRQNEEQRSVRPVTGAAAGNASHWSSHSNSKVYELWQSLHIRCQQTNTRVFVFEPCKFGEHILTYKRKYNLITS